MALVGGMASWAVRGRAGEEGESGDENALHGGYLIGRIGEGQAMGMAGVGWMVGERYIC